MTFSNITTSKMTASDSTQSAPELCEIKECGDDHFDVFLREQMRQAQPYVDDDQFTAQVIAKLPSPRKISRTLERLIIVLPCFFITLLLLSQFKQLIESVVSWMIRSWVWLTLLSVNGWLQLCLGVALLTLAGLAFWFLREVDEL